MRDYLRCIVANRACLSGVIMIIVGILIYPFTLFFDLSGPSQLKLFLSLLTLVLFEVGFITLIVTAFGLSTLQAYKRTKKHIQRFGKVGDNFNYQIYCNRVGYELAIKESGVRQ